VVLRGVPLGASIRYIGNTPTNRKKGKLYLIIFSLIPFTRSVLLIAARYDRPKSAFWVERKFATSNGSTDPALSQTLSVSCVLPGSMPSSIMSLGDGKKSRRV
jgi:hypothetical protein